MWITKQIVLAFCALATIVTLGSSSGARAFWPFDATAKDTTASSRTPVRVYRVTGAIRERGGGGGPLEGGRANGLGDLREAWMAEVGDATVKHLLVKVRDFGASPAQAEEIGALVESATRAGKQVTVHATQLDLLTLVAFGGANRVILTPEGSVRLTGLHVEVAFYRELMGKLGLEADFEAVGEFKSAGESYTRDTMSDAARENLDAWLDDVWSHLRKQISMRTKVSMKELDQLIDGGLQDPEAAKRAGLIDGLGYWSETVTGLESRHGATSVAWPAAPPTPEISSLFDLFSLLGEDGNGTASTRPTIAVLVAEGPIVEGRHTAGILDDSSVIAVENILDELHAITSDVNVKAIVVRINSPGGSALASDIIWRALSDAGKDRPIIVSMGSVAASGGYYIASAGRRIFADAMTLTGSIGVFGGKLVYADMTQKIGVHTTTLGRGKLHGMMSGLGRFTDDERAVFRAQLERTYRTFINRVARGRNMGFDAVEAVARGRIWTGAEALDKGLVDAIGGLDAAIGEALKVAKLEASDAEIRYWPRRKGLFELLSGEEGTTRIALDTIAPGALLGAIPAPLVREASRATALIQQLLGSHGVLMYLPIALTIQ